MKVFRSVVLLLAAVVGIYGLPAQVVKDKTEKPEKPDHEIEFVPLEAQKPGAVFPPGAAFPPGGVVDVDADGFFGNPFVGNPFPSLLSSIEALMNRMRQQLSLILGRLPDKAGETPFPELHIPNIGDVDLGKGNTTSITKVIDGHKVTINETEYKQDGEDGAAFFKVRIIDVHPDSEEASTEKDTEAAPVSNKHDIESVEDASDNEILAKKAAKDNEELNFDNIETFDEVDMLPPHKTVNVRRNLNWENAKSVESIEDNSIDAAPGMIRDLSNDIYVNQLMGDNGVPTNPDAEVFSSPISGHFPTHFYPEVPKNVAPLNQFQPNFPNDFRQPFPENNVPFFIPMLPANQPNMPIQNVMMSPPSFMAAPRYPMFQPNMFVHPSFPQQRSLPLEKLTNVQEATPSKASEDVSNAIVKQIEEKSTHSQATSSINNIPVPSSVAEFPSTTT